MERRNVNYPALGNTRARIPKAYRWAGYEGFTRPLDLLDRPRLFRDDLH
ncbi:hypothetical protein [Nocardiopsis sp. NPDC006832]